MPRNSDREEHRDDVWDPYSKVLEKKQCTSTLIHPASSMQFRRSSRLKGEVLKRIGAVMLSRYSPSMKILGCRSLIDYLYPFAIEVLLLGAGRFKACIVDCYLRLCTVRIIGCKSSSYIESGKYR
jgi:hypothetical protein